MSKILQGLNETQAHDGAFLLTESRTYKLWESAGQKISEAQLTADQINQIFKQVEQGATAAGGNRTMLGKGKDVASAVNKAWEELKGKVQDSGPIKGVDAMYDKAAEQLKQATGGDQGVMKYVQKYRDFAKKHPIAQSLIYSALIAAAGISGAGVGGAAALGLFKMVDKLLQGEKFSSATYQGAKTGAMAYGASKLADYVKGKPDASATPGSTSQGPNVDDKIAAARARVDAANAKLGIDGSAQNYDVTGNASQAAKDFEKLDKASLAQSMKMNPMLAQRAGMPGLPDASSVASGITDNPADWAKGINPPPDWVKDSATGTYAPPTDTVASTATSSGIQPKGGFGAQEKINQMMQAKADAAATSGVTARPSGLQPLNNLDGSVRPDAGAANAALSGGDVASNVASAAPKGAGLNAEYLNKVISGQIPRPTISPEQAQAALDWQSQNGGQLASAAKDTAAGAAKGYSQEYLQKVANGEVARPMITPEKAKQLLGQMNESVKLSESQIFLMIGKIVERQRKLDEGIMDTVKGAAGKAMNWAQTKGTNLTTKVTADKLLQAWKKADSPMDSLDVAKVIQNAGVPSDIIKQVYGSMKIPFAGEKGAGAVTARKIDVDPSSVAPGAPATPTATSPSATSTSPSSATSPAEPTGPLAQVQELVAKLDPATKEKVISTLKQELTVAESQVNELSTNKLAQYKTAAAADAKKADSESDYKRGDKRFSGIVKATKKQFANDEKQLKEFAADDGDGGGEEDTLRKFAKMWYNGDLGTQQQVEKLLARSGWEIGELESEEGGAFVVQSGDENGDSYIGFTADDLTDELDENCWKGYHKEGNKELFGKTVPNCVKNEDVAEGVAETLPIHDAVKVLKQYGADNFKTTSNELHFYKNGRPLSVDLIWGNEGERSVNLSQLNSATRQLKGQGVAEDQRLDPSCWKGYKKQGTKMKGDTRVNNCVPVKESAILKGLVDENRQGDK